MEQIFSPESYRITDLIHDLQNMQEIHGNLPVTYELQRGGVRFVDFEQPPLAVKSIKIPEKRERVLQYWQNFHGENNRGQIVLALR